MAEIGKVNKNITRGARGRESGIHGGHRKKNTFATQEANYKLKFPSVLENRTEKDGQEIHQYLKINSPPNKMKLKISLK